MTTIFIDGGNVRPDGNKGDELMMHTVLRRLRAADAQVQLVVDPRTGPFKDRARLGLYQALWPFSVTRLSTSIGYFVSKRYAPTFGIVPESGLEWVINFQGYRYADIGLAETKGDLVKAERRSKSWGTRYIYLPQAYGPFKDPALRKAALRLFSLAELICARDEQSREHLIQLGLPASAVEVFPDITIAEVASGQEESPQDQPFVCIIPNIWMVQRTDKAQSEAYVDFLIFVCKEVQRRGALACLVDHSPFQDEPIVRRVAAEVGGGITIACERDPLRLKALIGRSLFVVGSRYHALVAALSQSVPAIGTSWAHKYEALYDDYGCRELLVSAVAPRNEVVATLERLFDSGSRRELTEHLKQRNIALKARLEVLWNKVYSIIGLTGQS